MFEALGWSGHKALYNEGAFVVPPRELPKSLKRGPLGGCLGIIIPYNGICFCEFVLRVQSFVADVRRRVVGIDHALIPACVCLYFG